nr:CRISPR-associated endonuclease Cas2 [Curtanaerobium respiraculi]
MFDLPTETKAQRHDATKFRKLLVDSGFAMLQYSVYGKYSPSIHTNNSIERIIRASLPANGEVRIFHLTDCQWANATRFVSKKPTQPESRPDQLQLF